MNVDPTKIQLADAAKQLKDRAELKVGEVEEMNVYLTAYLGEYPAHKHPKDEFFYVIQGQLELELAGDRVLLREGDCIPVKKGTVHKPSAKSRTLVLKVEPREFPFEMTGSQ